MDVLFRDIASKMLTSTQLVALADIEESQSPISVCGVNMDLSVTKRSRGTDFSLTVSLMDPTCNGPLKINIFQREKENLPLEIAGGTPILLEGVKIQRFNGRLQGVSTRFFAMKVSSPAEASSSQQSSQTLTQQESQPPIDQMWSLLRFWWSQNGCTADYKVSSRAPKLVKNIQSREFFDLFCQVVAIRPSDDPSRLEIAVTDFTRHESLRRFIQSELYPDLPANMILNCTLWGHNAQAGLELKLGDFVFLRNAHAKTVDHQVECIVHTDGKNAEGSIRKADPNEPEVIEIRRRRATEKFFQEPTEIVDAAAIPFMTLREATTSSEHPIKFQCQVRVVDHLPPDIRDFTCTLCENCGGYCDFIVGCEVCGENQLAVRRFLFSLLVTDGTGFIPAIVSNEEAV
ncbi:hypothetical protein DFJ73DRAFT_825299 [Zopfochytrium polystomum]|nr:hypothetical protein DFJ73DRAFT_825299 [Zopfochytrium polystomum]